MMWKVPIMAIASDNANASPIGAFKPPAAPARWPEFMDVLTLFEYLDMSPSSFRKLVETGVIPGRAW